MSSRETHSLSLDRGNVSNESNKNRINSRFLFSPPKETTQNKTDPSSDDWQHSSDVQVDLWEVPVSILFCSIPVRLDSRLWLVIPKIIHCFSLCHIAVVYFERVARQRELVIGTCRCHWFSLSYLDRIHQLLMDFSRCPEERFLRPMLLCVWIIQNSLVMDRLAQVASAHFVSRTSTRRLTEDLIADRWTCLMVIRLLECRLLIATK